MLKSILSLAAALIITAGGAQFAQADPIRGRLTDSKVAPANTVINYYEVFRANEVTRIRVAGDGDTCLELRVYDGNGNLVASDTYGNGDVRTVNITPKWTGKFTVKVFNRGSVGNHYGIVMD